MTAQIQISPPATVEMPASRAGRKADLPFDFSTLEVGQSVFVPGKDNQRVVRKVYEAARRHYGRQGAPRVDADGNQLVNEKTGKPLFHRVYEREFTVRFVEDGAAYGKKFAGQDGYALFRTK